MRTFAIIGLLLAACGARGPHLFAPSPAPAPGPGPTRIAACPAVARPVVLPTTTAHAIAPPPTGADVLRIDLIGGATTLVTIDRGSDDNVRVGDRGWLIDDDGHPVRASEFVVSTVGARESRGAIRLLDVAEVRRHPRAQLVPTN